MFVSADIYHKPAHPLALIDCLNRLCPIWHYMILSFFRIGRKPTMYVSTLFLLAIALSIAWAPSIEVYMIQSACLGFFVVGMFMPIYVTGMLSWLQ